MSTDAWLFVGVHSTVLGPAMGGTRLKAYASPDDALIDVLRLSAAMTFKQAAADLPYGGGKAVIAVPAVPAPQERGELLRRYGRLVDSLHGTYVTAADMNTNQTDMDVIGEVTSHVLGRSREVGGSGDPAPGTAVGVFHGIVASARHAFGSDDLADVRVLVQGVGSVGGRLIGLLRDAGARVLVSDVDETRAREAAASVEGSVVAPEDVIGTECDVYAPCALGATLSTESVPQLRCRIVAGSANNQLAEYEAAELLRTAGILYAPDYVINAGGAIAINYLELNGRSQADVDAALVRIGDTLREIYVRADTEGITTAAAADALAASRLT